MIEKLMLEQQTILCRIVLAAFRDVHFKMNIDGWLAFLKGSKVVTEQQKDFYKANYFMSLFMLERRFIRCILDYLYINKYLKAVQIRHRYVIEISDKGLEFLQNESATIDFIETMLNW
jgi:hypothetical protein